MDCDGRLRCGLHGLHGLHGLRWMDCNGLRWNALEWLVELTPIRAPLHFDAPILITHDARASTIQVCALKTALRAQNGAACSNGVVCSKRRCAFKRCCSFKRGSAEGRQISKKGSAGDSAGGSADDAFGLLSCCAVHDFVTEDGSFACHE